MDSSQNLYFIALLPPKDISTQINQIKQHFADHYNTCAAFKSPPHITLQPPFEWPPADLPHLNQCLSAFAKVHSAFAITLSGFGAFAPRVIFVNVLKTPALIDLHTQLQTYLETNLNITTPQAKQHPFSPHITVAYRDLSRQNFDLAWPEFASRPFQFEFTPSVLTLLVHADKQWNIHSEFAFC